MNLSAEIKGIKLEINIKAKYPVIRVFIFLFIPIIYTI